MWYDDCVGLSRRCERHLVSCESCVLLLLLLLYVSGGCVRCGCGVMDGSSEFVILCLCGHHSCMRGRRCVILSVVKVVCCCCCCCCMFQEDVLGVDVESWMEVVSL